MRLARPNQLSSSSSSSSSHVFCHAIHCPRLGACLRLPVRFDCAGLVVCGECVFCLCICLLVSLGPDRTVDVLRDEHSSVRPFLHNGRNGPTEAERVSHFTSARGISQVPHGDGDNDTIKRHTHAHTHKHADHLTIDVRPEQKQREMRGLFAMRLCGRCRWHVLRLLGFDRQGVKTVANSWRFFVRLCCVYYQDPDA